MAALNDEARRLVASGRLAHLVTINEDGGPQVSVVWMGLDGDELVSAHLDGRQRKLANVRRDPRVTVSFESELPPVHGMTPYLVVHGTARLTEGGAPELLHQLAQTYIGPGHGLPADARPAARVRPARPRRPGGRLRTLVIGRRTRRWPAP